MDAISKGAGRMSKIEAARTIVENGGSCAGIYCRECFNFDADCSGVPVDNLIAATAYLAEHDTEHVYNCKPGGYATPNPEHATTDQPTAKPPIEPLVYSPHNDVKNMVDTMKRVNELTEIINHLNKEVE